jgi:hypothetical protein
LIERGHHGAHRRVITGEAVAPLEANTRSRAQHERAALLDGIAAPGPLPESARERANAVDERARINGATPPGGEARRLKGPEGRVGQEVAAVAGDVAKSLEVLGSPGAQHDEVSASCLDLASRSVESSHLLATEDSAEVANEPQNRRRRIPEAPERNGFSALIEDAERREPDSHVIAHAKHPNYNVSR